MSEKTLLMIDASALKESSCGLKFFLNVHMGYGGEMASNDTEIGSAIHKFRATFRESFTYEAMALAMVEAKEYFETRVMKIKSNKTYLTPEYLTLACSGYASRYMTDSFKPLKDKKGKALLELPFVFPYYIDDEFEVMIAGTVDEIGQWYGGNTNGMICVSDLKTTSSWKVDEYLCGYELSPQMIMYVWALKQYAKAFPDSSIGAACKTQIGVFIDGIFFKGKDTPIEYKRSRILTFNDEMLAEFELLLQNKIKTLLFHIREHNKTKQLPIKEGIINGACAGTFFGPCKYFPACASQSDTTMKIILETQYKQRPYNPLAFHE
jgi:hypothetical protein